jgi:hypothetical protein
MRDPCAACAYIEKGYIAIATITTTITTPTTIPMIALVCKPLLGGRADSEGEGVFACCEVLIVIGTVVAVKANMVVTGREELVIDTSNGKWDWKTCLW